MTSKNAGKHGPANPCIELPLLTSEVVQAMHIFRQTKNSKLGQAAQWIQRALNLERAHDKWVTEAIRLVNEGTALLRPDTQPQHDNGRVTDLSSEHTLLNGDKKYGGKPRADACRSALLRREESRGNPLTPDPLRGPYYRNGRGLLIGLTFSSDLGNRWWVNFKKECEEIVMLCDSKGDAVRVVHLAQPFFEEYRRHFHPGEDGLIQITLRMRDGKFYAQVPDHGQVDVTKYADREPLVCKRHDELEFV